MKLNIVSAGAGVHWVRMGLRTFARHPGALLALLLLYLIVSLALSLVPFVGIAFLWLITPALTAGQLEGSRMAAGGQSPAPSVLFSALRRPLPDLRPILMLGIWYMAISVVVQVMAEYAGAWLAAGGRIKASEATMGFALLFYLPLFCLLWFASGLAHWHAVPPGQGLFYAVVACWRNLKACLVYLAAWIGLAMVAAIASLLVALPTLPIVGGLVWMLLASLLAAGLSTSTYFAFQDCFQAPSEASPEENAP